MVPPFLETTRKSAIRTWDFLTRPSPSITNPQIRQQSRLLASVMLAAMLAIFVQILVSTRTSNALSGSGVWLLVSIGLMILVWVAYVLTRKGYYRFATYALLILGTGGILVPALIIGGRSSYNSLFYLFIVTLFACTFLSVRAAIVSAGIQLVLLLMLHSSFPNIPPQNIISGPLSFNAFLTVFILVLAYHQRRAFRERSNELSASEERYRIVSELISDYAYSLRVTPQGDLQHEWITEDSFKRVTGYAHDELDDDDHVNLSLFLAEDEPQLHAEIDQVLRNEPSNARHRIRTKSGEIRWLQIFRLPVWDAKEKRVTRFYGIAQDITERQRAENALKESEERYRLLTETISDFVILYDVPTSKILYISPSYERALGYTLDEINALDASKRVHPDDLEMATAVLMQVISGQAVEGVQYRSRTKSGDYIWVEAYSNPVKDAQGKVVQVIISTRDITSRKQTEMALKASEERYRIISELISDYAYFYRFNPDGSRTREWITDSVERVTGFAPSELPQQTVGLTDKSYLGNRNEAQDDIERIHRGAQLHREFQTYTKQRELRWLSVFRRPVWNDEHTEVIGYYGVAQDITERKQAELALQASEERYRILTELTSDYAYFFRINDDDTLTREWITDSVEQVTGYPPDEMPQDTASLAKIFFADDISQAFRETELLKQGQAVSSESRMYNKRGQLRWLSIMRRPVWNADKTRVAGYYGVVKDITDRKLAEVALVDSEQRYRKISELISDYAFYTRINEDGTMVREWITDSFLRVTGYLPEEIDANSASKLFHAESLKALAADHERMMTGEAISNDYRIMTKQGAIRWLNLVRQPAWDKDHTRIIGYFGVARDVTEHKQVEAQKIKLMLEQEQFSMVGHLVEALSHDFRTALATIETSRYLTERLVGDDVRPTVQPKLESIQRAVNHIATQLEHLHMVSFLTGPSFSPCNLNYIVNGIMSDQIVRADQKHIKLLFKADDGLPILRIDAVKIEKAIRHLVANALTHTPESGTVTIYTRHTAEHAIIEVQDTGSGIPPEILEHIFEPFFRGDKARTVDKGGVGLGLTIVKMIVEAHGGTVIAHSMAGMGSIFVLSLPLKEEIAASA
jgi:PAS domain S-box-containing protein